MADVVLFHLVGNGDLALRPGEDPTAALARLESDPETGLLERRDDHPDAEASPIPSAIETLKHLGHKVTRIVLFVTQQTPPHPHDTGPWTPVLTKAVEALHPLNLDNAPIDVTTATVTNFSIQGFAKRATKQAEIQTDQIVVPIASGATSAFMGILIGAINAGTVPLVVPVGKPGEATTLSSLVELDLVRWLTRRRMWSAIAALPSAPDHIRHAAQQLDRYERHEATTRPNLPTDRASRLISATVSQWAVDDPTWLTGLLGIGEALAKTLIDQLPPADRAEVKRQATAWRKLERVSEHTGAHDAQICWEVAKHYPGRWKRWGEAPKGLKQWFDDLLALTLAKDARHGRLPETLATPRNQTTLEYRFLSAVSQGNKPSLRQPPRDKIPALAMVDLDAGHPDTPLPRARLTVRLVGVRNANGVIDSLIDHHLSTTDTPHDVRLPSIAIASEQTARQGHIPLPPHDLASATATALTQLRMLTATAEQTHECRIATVALYLNQGTKVMNYAALRAVLSVATELNATVELFDVAATNTGASSITALPTDNVELLARTALPGDVIRTLLRSAVRFLDVVPAVALANVLADDALQEDVQRLAAMMLWPVRSVASHNLAERLRAIAPAVTLLLQQRGEIGDREAVTRLAVLLSTATADGRDDPWKAATPALEHLWSARNKTFHDRTDGKFTFPTDLERGCLFDIAKAMKVKLDPSTMPWNDAIDLHARILRRIETPAVD